MAQELRRTFLDICNTISILYEHKEGKPYVSPIDMEPYLIQLLRLVHTYPNNHDTFVELFVMIANGTIASPWFLLGFCMHELRYQKVYDTLLKEYKDGYTRNTFGRRMNYLYFNLAIFKDQEPDFVQMWSYYQ